MGFVQVASEYWKFGNVTPIHKKRQTRHVSNYRPISLLPVISKLQERLVDRHSTVLSHK